MVALHVDGYKTFPDYRVSSSAAGAGQFTATVVALVRTAGEDGKWYSQVISHTHRGLGETETEREAVKSFIISAVNTMVLGIPNSKLVDTSGHEIYRPDENQQTEKARLMELLPKLPKK